MKEEAMPSKGSKTYQYASDTTGLNGPKGQSVSKARLILEQKIGRKLKPNEVVDHKDSNEKNLNPDNLRVLTSHTNDSLGGKHGAAVTNAKRGRQSRKP